MLSKKKLKYISKMKVLNLPQCHQNYKSDIFGKAIMFQSSETKILAAIIYVVRDVIPLREMTLPFDS